MATGAWTPPVDYSALRWTPVTGARAFELRAGETLLGELRWGSRFGSLAEVALGPLQLSLKRSGFLAPQVLARDRPGGTERARLHVHGSHSRVEVAGAGAYELRRAGLLVPSWRLTTPDRRPVLNLEAVEEHGRLEGGLVTVEPAFRAVTELPLLLAVSWYFIVLAWFEEVAVLAGDAVLRAASDP
jgi:hypothetical protein